jgi:hypothetical protein
MDGDAVYVSGKWQLIAGYHKPPALHIDESSLGNGTITISPYAPTSQLINAISGQYKGPETKYQSLGYPITAPEAYQIQDGDQQYERKDDFELVNDAMRCQMIAWQRLTRARQQLSISLDCNLKAYNVSPLQTVTLSLAEFGYINKIFQVRKRTFSGSHIEYNLQETDAAVWNWNYLQSNAVVDLPNINVPVKRLVGTLTGIVATSGTNVLKIDADGTVRSRIKLTWDLPASTYVKNGGQIEWQYRTTDVGSGAGVWLNAPYVAGDNTSVFIDGVQDSVSYDLRGRSISQVGTLGVATTIVHVVIGKTAPPSNVTDLRISGATISWPVVTDLDLAGYILKFGYGSNVSWDTATTINDGVLTQSPFDWTQRPSGSVTILIKAVDTTGNESLAPAAIFTDLGDATVSNIVEQFDFHPLFNGGVTGATVISSELRANGTTSFYPAGNQPMYPAGLEPFYPTSNYEELVYITNPIVISSVLSGSIATLLLNYSGLDAFVEYRVARIDAMFSGLDSDPFYTPDDDGFWDNSVDSPFYTPDGDPMYTPDDDPYWEDLISAYAGWIPFPGQIQTSATTYQFRVTLGAGTTRGIIHEMSFIIDAPDIEETINDLSISIGGTVLPYVKNFTVIKGIQATLQSGLTGAVNIVTNKTVNLSPVVTAINVSNNPVAGASGDFTIKGY